MNPSSLTNPPPESPPPVGWREALGDWATARVELIQIESREASRSALRKGVLAGALAATVFFIWALLLAGGIGLLTAYLESCGHPWGWPAVTLAAAGLHALLALGLAVALRRPTPPPFPITRSEFEKDREWLKTLKTPRG